MLGKVLFCVSSFITTWTGIVLVINSYAIPGVVLVATGYAMFKVACPTEEGETW